MTGIATPAEREAFIEALVRWGAPVAQREGLPPAAMVACGLVESGYGVSEIYKRTHCPFNLQKPSWYHWVHCFTINLPTNTRTDAAGRPTNPMVAPFCYAMGSSEEEWLPDAVRIWCDWVNGWPQVGVRSRLLGMRHNPALFAQNLPLVGFGERDKAARNGATFASVLRQYQLVKRCMLAVAVAA